MLYEIKVLKAPWPKGAKVGDVIDMPAVPVWAQGKCAPASADAEPTIEFVEALVGDGAGQTLPTVESINPELEQARGALTAAHEQLRGQSEDMNRLMDELRDLSAKAAGDKAQADDDTAALRAELQAAQAKVAELQAKLDAPVTDDAKAVTALQEAEAQAETERKAAEGKTPAKGKSK